MFAETVDDPYITFRYAANIIAGNGPVYNIGERVEGYTSPLHLLLSILLLKTLSGVDILFKAKCASLFFALASVSHTGKLARISGLNAYEIIIAQTFLAININFALAAVNGLETTLYVYILLSAILVFITECLLQKGYASALIFFIAVLARPDASVVFVALFLVRIAWTYHRRSGLQFISAWLLAFIIPTTLYEIARWRYYGLLLPNTYYAKSQHSLHSFLAGLTYLLRADWPDMPTLSVLKHDLTQLSLCLVSLFHVRLQHSFCVNFILCVVTAIFWLAVVLGIFQVKRLVWRFTCYAVLTAIVLFNILVGGDWMYGWRFMVPALPILVILQCFSLRLPAQRIQELRNTAQKLPSNKYPNRRWQYHFIAIVLYALLLIQTPHYSWMSVHFSIYGPKLLSASEGLGPFWVKCADYIRHNINPRACVAYTEMGYAGFSNMDKTFIDMRGLTDKQIATMPLSYKTFVGVVDHQWYVPSDPLYNILMKKKPDTVMSFDGTPKNVTLLHYHFVDIIPVSAEKTTISPVLSIYARD